MPDSLPDEDWPMPDEEPEVELLPDLEGVDDFDFVPVLPLPALAVVEPEPVVDDLLLPPDPLDDEEEEVGELEDPEPEEPVPEEPKPEDPELDDPKFEEPVLVPEFVFKPDPELPVLPLIPVLLLPIDDESDDPDVLPDMPPEFWFFSLSFIVKISWIYIVKNKSDISRCWLISVIQHHRKLR